MIHVVDVHKLADNLHWKISIDLTLTLFLQSLFMTTRNLARGLPHI